ncbi:MAG TPA: hypothetical protein VFM53_14495 [Anaeromyxobacteraceae bacterium]|nr:hypothetical protein [Anaeromyxobacteraceae bacterium]
MARILILDGDPESRESLEACLADEGLDPVAAAEAEAAWEAFATLSPRAVVLGRRLPRAEVEGLIFRLRRADPDLLILGQGDSPADTARDLRIRLGSPAPRASALPAPGGPGAERVLSRPALERGDVAFGTVADLLARLWRSGADGIVAVEHPGGAEDQVFLLRGASVDARLHADDRAPDVARAVSSLCATAAGTFRFHPGAEFAREVRAAAIPALSPLLHGLRRSADEPSFAASLAELSATAPRPGAVAAAVSRALAPDPADAAVLAALDGSRTLDALLRSPGRPASLLWFLARCGALLLEPAAPALVGLLAGADEPALAGAGFSLEEPGPPSRA